MRLVASTRVIEPAMFDLVFSVEQEQVSEELFQRVDFVYYEFRFVCCIEGFRNIELHLSSEGCVLQKNVALSINYFQTQSVGTRKLYAMICVVLKENGLTYVDFFAGYFNRTLKIISTSFLTKKTKKVFKKLSSNLNTIKINGKYRYSVYY